MEDHMEDNDSQTCEQAIESYEHVANSTCGRAFVENMDDYSREFKCSCEATVTLIATLSFAVTEACEDDQAVDFVTVDKDFQELIHDIAVECTINPQPRDNPNHKYCRDVIDSLTAPPECHYISLDLGCCAGTAYLTGCGELIKDSPCDPSVWQTFCPGSPTECFGDHDDHDHDHDEEDDDSASMPPAVVDLCSVISLMTVGLFAAFN